MKKHITSSTLSALPIKDRLSQITEEIRIVLPGAGVILGFQLVVPFSYSFNTLSSVLQNTYIASLVCVVLTVILLIAPVALDRLTDDNTDLQVIYHFANTMIRISLLTFAMGISLDIFIIISFITNYSLFGGAIAVGLFSLSLALWFGYSLYKNKTT